ncbi:MAG: hypothetical protein PHU25_15100 [Deltaproteobacteria bacterium]|nr:hypothetical protein [Deltaproteobacteria bacterium]
MRSIGRASVSSVYNSRAKRILSGLTGLRNIYESKTHEAFPSMGRVFVDSDVEDYDHREYLIADVKIFSAILVTFVPLDGILPSAPPAIRSSLV